MNFYLKLFIIISIVAALITIPVVFGIQDYNNSKMRRKKELQTNYDSLKEKLKTFLNTSNTVFESRNLIPTIDKKHDMLLISNKNLQKYADKNYLDFIKIPNEKHIFEMLLTMIEYTKYEYVLFFDSKYINDNTTQDIKQFIYKSGDNDLILFSNLQTKQINDKAFIYRSCEFSKLHIFNVIKNASKLSYNIYTNQLYTEYLPNIELKHPYIPKILSGIVIYNENILNNINTNNYVYPFSNILDNKFTEIISEDLPEIPDNDTNIIPKNIFQIMETNITLKSQHKHVIQRVKNMNPGYNYYFLNGFQGKQFIKNNFNNRVLYAYDKLLPGAFKSDLLRYCLLYKYGGIYIDFNVYMLKKFDDIIETGDEFISASDSNRNNSLWQGFLVSKPKHPIMKLCIDMCCDNIINENYDKFGEKSGARKDLNITGPELIGDVVDIKNDNEKLNIGLNGNIRIFEFINSKPYITDTEGVKIACTKYFKDEMLKVLYPNVVNDSDTFYKVLGGKEPYGKAYKNKRIYKFNN